MKTFRELVTEISINVPVINIDTSGTDVSIPEVKNELNRNIDLILKQEYQTVEEALAKLSKILAMYSLDIPQVDSDNKKSDSMNLVVGHHNLVWDEFEGKMVESNPFILNFSYTLSDGLYKCSAELQ
jgi:hypothetical protein